MAVIRSALNATSPFLSGPKQKLESLFSLQHCLGRKVGRETGFSLYFPRITGWANLHGHQQTHPSFVGLTHTTYQTWIKHKPEQSSSVAVCPQCTCNIFEELYFLLRLPHALSLSLSSEWRGGGTRRAPHQFCLNEAT